MSRYRSCARIALSFTVTVADSNLSLALDCDAYAPSRQDVITGTLIALDARGTEVVNESGFALVQRSLKGNTGDYLEIERVTILDGRFTLSVSPGDVVRFDAFELDHGTATWLRNDGVGDYSDFPWSDGLLIADNHPIIVRARLVPATKVRVVDDESGNELSDVDLIRSCFRDSDGSISIDSDLVSFR